MKLGRVIRLILVCMPVFAGWQVVKWDKTYLQLRWRGAPAGAEKAFRLAVPADARLLLKHQIKKERPCPGGGQPPEKLSRGFFFRESGRGRYRDTEVASLVFSRQYTGDTHCREVRDLELGIRFLYQDGLPASGWRGAFPEAAHSPAEKLLKSLVVNYDQSRIFRTVPVRGSHLAKNSFTGSLLPARRLKIRTSSEKIHIVTYDDLERAGLSLKDIDPRQLRLYHAEREMPLYIHGEADGRWDRGDYIEFIGKRPLGTLLQSGKRAYHSFYTAEAVLLLVWDMPGRGLRAPLIPVAGDYGGVVFGGESPLPEAGPHPVSVHLEEDEEVLRLGGVGVAEVQDLGASVEAVQLADFWHWTRQGAELDIVNIPFTLAYTPVRKEESDSSRQLHVTVEMRGLTDVLTAPFDHHVKFLINSIDISQIGSVENTAKWAGNKRHVWQSTPLNQNILQPGKNIFTIQKIKDLKTTTGEPVKIQDAYLNFLEFRFFADYRVVDDELSFSSNYPAQRGRHIFLLKNLTADDYSLWDIEGRKLTGFNLFSRGKDKQLSFSDNIVSNTTYILSSKERRLSPRLELDTLDDLYSASNQADYLIITQNQLLGPSLDSLVDLRSSQGLNCRIVKADHIYQSFGDGATDPDAIRDFVRFTYFYWKRPAPLYLLIVGEATMWFDKKAGLTQVNIVPSHLIHIPGWGVSSNDDYYVKVAGDDNICDLLVGRIPVANKSDLANVVAKIYRHETGRKPGHWQNKILLLGGYEPAFTRTNYDLQEQIVGENRQFSRLDVDVNSPYRRGLDHASSVAAQLDSAFNLVSFVGHGGGAVWSDAGLLTLDGLNSLHGTQAIPMVFSMTCLTGYFEDIAAPSLGEELLRMPLGGAAAFYGASGYISAVAGDLLIKELMETAISQKSITAGHLIQAAENNLSLITGGKFALITGEFDLLGDPALRLGFPEVTKGLSISHRFESGAHHLEITAKKLPMTEGEGVLSVIIDDSTAVTKQVAFSNSKLQEDADFGWSDRLFSRGKVIFHFWNNKKSHVAAGEFSALDWMITSLKTVPEQPAIGESVLIRFKMSKVPGKIDFKGGVISHMLAQEKPLSFDSGKEILLKKTGDYEFESVSPFKLLTDSLKVSNPTLFIRIRMSFDIVTEAGGRKAVPNLESHVMGLGVKSPSDLAFLDRGFSLPIQNKLGVWVHFINKGYGSDSLFQIILETAYQSGTPGMDTVVYQNVLGPNSMDSVFFQLDEKIFNKPIHVSIRSVLENREHDKSNNSADTVILMGTKMLKSGSDTLRLSERLRLTPGEDGFVGRVFTARVPCPERLPQHLLQAHLENGLPVCYEMLQAGDAANEPLRLIGSIDPVLRKTATGTPAWHYYVAGDDNWLALEKAQGNQGLIEASTYGSGLYGVFFNSDNQKPVVEFTSRGHLLLQDDFVPQNAPIEITLRDNAGVDFLKNTPSITLPSSGDSTRVVISHSGALSKTGLIRLRPIPGIQRDSIEIQVSDISGNTISLPFAYRYGSGLKIHIFGNYPNPFADTTVIVYQLTDWAETLQLKIYSRAGRIVRTFSDNPESGYKEIVWDGKTQSGQEIANGLYYLKVLAERKGKKVSGTLKLFKKKLK